MSGGGRTAFFGLIGIMISLAVAFVLFQQHQHRLREREREKTTEPAGPKRAGAPSPPAKRRP
jgi:hypothetical protein